MILSSCEALPPLSTPSLKELAKVVPYIIVQELPDSAAANARKRMASETVLKPVPNIFVSPLPGAYCHKLHNSMVRAMGEKEIIGDVHASAYVATLASHHAQKLRALYACLDATLEWDRLQSLDPEWAHHKQLLDAYSWEKPLHQGVFRHGGNCIIKSCRAGCHLGQDLQD